MSLFLSSTSFSKLFASQRLVCILRLPESSCCEQLGLSDEIVLFRAASSCKLVKSTFESVLASFRFFNKFTSFQEIAFLCVFRIQFCLNEVCFEILHDRLTAVLTVENHSIVYHILLENVLFPHNTCS